MADKRETCIPGLAIFGLFVSGLSALGLAFWAADMRQFAASGILLIAATIAFGIPAYISFK